MDSRGKKANFGRDTGPPGIFNLKLRHGGRIRQSLPAKYLGGSVSSFNDMVEDEWGLICLKEKVLEIWIVKGGVGDDADECDGSKEKSDGSGSEWYDSGEESNDVTIEFSGLSNVKLQPQQGNVQVQPQQGDEVNNSNEGNLVGSDGASLSSSVQIPVNLVGESMHNNVLVQQSITSDGTQQLTRKIKGKAPMKIARKKTTMRKYGTRSSTTFKSIFSGSGKDPITLD
nr:uncharacterized protein LOC109184816 [Ipomoea batatas]